MLLYSLTGQSLPSGSLLTWSAPGPVSLKEIQLVAPTGVEVRVEKTSAVPQALELSTPFPNPAILSKAGQAALGPLAVPAIQFQVAVPQVEGQPTLPVSLEVFNLRGQRVTRVFEGELRPGRHVLQWLGQTDHQEPAASGIYIALLKAHGQTLRKAFTVIRR